MLTSGRIETKMLCSFLRKCTILFSKMNIYYRENRPNILLSANFFAQITRIFFVCTKNNEKIIQLWAKTVKFFKLLVHFVLKIFPQKLSGKKVLNNNISLLFYIKFVSNV
jgi:hypothetical protein